jgi:hypothetical protein
VSKEVYANMMEISCKAGDGKSIAAMPDVCMTPPQTPATPPGVPVPYPNTGMSSDCSDGSSTVSIGGQEVMLKDKSYFKQSSGDEAGCAPMKGVISHTNRGKVYFAMWSMDVQIEGENVVRHLDVTTHNHASQAGNESVPWPEIESMTPPPTSRDKPCEKPCNDKKVSTAEKDSLRKTPEYEAAAERVNSGPKPLMCPFCNKPKERLSPDHIMPITATIAMPGFACLSKKDQSKIVNDPGNFVSICGICNSSKSGKLWHEWKGYSKAPVGQHTIDEGMDHTAAIATKQWEMVKAAPCKGQP